jgi:hypothetical protein
MLFDGRMLVAEKSLVSSLVVSRKARRSNFSVACIANPNNNTTSTAHH